MGLPPSILNLITRLLPYDSVINLGLLSGATGLWPRLTTLGGSKELVVTDERSARYFFLSFSSVRFFNGLTHVLRLPEPFTLPKSFVRSLPLTLLELSIDTSAAWEFFLRAFDVSSDPPELMARYSYGGLLSLSLKTAFPNLRTLAIMGEEKLALSEIGLSYFIAQLPSSLTSLQLFWAEYRH